MNSNIDISYKKRQICSKKFCTGCKACEQICPKKAIVMIKNEEGFEYPEIDDKCINCGLCKSVCPILNEVKDSGKLEKQKVFSCENIDYQVLMNSSSGGAFTSIVEAFCDYNYVIFGVEFNEKHEAVHTYVEDKNEISKYRKSKYVQSNIGDSYKLVKEFLNAERKVLFTGTPCEIAGLKQYLRKEYDNLLTVDLICHGVPSQKVLDKYIIYAENKYKSKVRKINFREKTKKNGIWNSRNILENGCKIIENEQLNSYLKGFHSNLFFRIGCYNCKFANKNRVSDITIGDSWGIEKLYPDIDVHKGQSLLIVNTKKGERIYKTIKMYQNYKEIDIQFAVNTNLQLKKPAILNKKRKYFFEHLDTMEFDKLINKCDNKLKIYIKKIIPKKLKKIYKKIKMGEVYEKKI